MAFAIAAILIAGYLFDKTYRAAINLIFIIILYFAVPVAALIGFIALAQK